MARAFPRPLFRGRGRRVSRVHHDSGPHPPRSHLRNLPRPESPCGMQPSPRVMGHPWDAGKDGGSGRSGICVQEDNKAGDYRSGASILGVETPAQSPRRSRYRHSCLGGPLPYPVPPPSNPSSRPCGTTRSSEHAVSHPSPSITRAPPSPRARGTTRSQRPEYAGSTLGCESRRPVPPPPGPALVPALVPARLPRQLRRHRRT